jgi:hypothetical protein
VNRVLAAEAAILGKLDTIRVVLFVFKGIVIPLLAFGAGQRNFNAHDFLPPTCKR